MRVVHLIPALNKGGTERLVINLTKRQIELGMEVAIISFSNINHYSGETEGLNIQFFPGSSIQYRFLAPPVHNLSKLEDFLLKFKPDIIHSHSYWTDLLVHGLDVCGPKYVSHFHLYYEAYALKPGLSKSFLSAFYDKCNLLFSYWKKETKFILVSKDITEYYKKLFPTFFHLNFYYIPNAGSVKPYINQTSIAHGFLKLFSAGRLVEVKNHSFLLDVAAELDRRGVHFDFKIAGDGPLMEELERKIMKLNLERKVKLLGNVNDIGIWYSWCDLYLHSATSESFGLTILEAMADGKPCISLRAGGNEDLITDGLEGILLEKSVSAIEYVEKILMLKKNEKLYQKMAELAFHKSKLFNINQYADKVLEVYRS